MKKQIIKIISFVFVILFILFTPIYTYFQSNDAYALGIAISKELEKQTLIPLLIASGLVFKSQEAVEETYERLDDFLASLGPGFELPTPDPEDPKETLLDALKKLANSKVTWGPLTGSYNKIVEVSAGLWMLIKQWVDENYDGGINSFFSYPGYKILFLKNIERGQIIENLNMEKGQYFSWVLVREGWTDRIDVYLKKKSGGNQYISLNEGDFYTLFLTDNEEFYSLSARYNNNDVLYYRISDLYVLPENREIVINGFPDIVDNPNFDWNNPNTNSKIITLPVKTDAQGTPEVDSEGYHIPAVDTEYWVDKEPYEIIESDPSGIPEPEPGEDTETGILNMLKNFLYYFQNISKNVSDIKQNTDAIAEGSGNGNGNDTEVPTGFEWGDFKKFFDIIMIFIYFIVILILILVKLLTLVFTGLVNIPANAALFNQYPTILAGVNYLKSLKVGGLSITVHQAFEYVFTIFFFIFIIKQIRKLYDSYVYEENERNRTALKQR